MLLGSFSAVPTKKIPVSHFRGNGKEEGAVKIIKFSEPENSIMVKQNSQVKYIERQTLNGIILVNENIAVAMKQWQS